MWILIISMGYFGFSQSGKSAAITSIPNFKSYAACEVAAASAKKYLHDENSDEAVEIRTTCVSDH